MGRQSRIDVFDRPAHSAISEVQVMKAELRNILNHALHRLISGLFPPIGFLIGYFLVPKFVVDLNFEESLIAGGGQFFGIFDAGSAPPAMGGTWGLA